jgi:branched-chain amino acid transport system permease protein
MSELTGAISSSLFYGTALGLMALAFTIIYTVSQVFNFAVGQFMILAALLTTAVHFTGNVVVNDLLSIALVAGMGAAAYLVALRWPEAHGANPLTLVIITFGVGIVVEQVVELAWGSYPYSETPILSGHFVLYGNYIPYQGLLLMAVAVITVIALGLAQRRTIAGKQLLALGGNRATARYFGVNDLMMVTIAWALSFAILAIVGTLYLPLTGVSITTDLSYGIAAFAAAVVGGLGNPGGALAGGLVVAFVTNFTGIYGNPNITDLLTFALLFAFLIFRPGGLTGRAIDLLGPRA